MSNSSASRDSEKSKNEILHHATMLFEQGTEDYAAARCCLINHLFSGLPMAAQAAEKYLKAFIYFLDTTYSEKRGHDLISLGQDLANRNSSFLLPKYLGLLAKLSNHYESRYPENRKTNSACTSIIGPFDDLMVYLAETMPLSHMIKYTYGFHAWTALLETKGWPNQIWLTKDNHAYLASKLVR